jgi:dipeptidyl aminopeptidase/acylaminoacyl peptidase
MRPKSHGESLGVAAVLASFAQRRIMSDSGMATKEAAPTSELRDLLKLTDGVAPEPLAWTRGDSAILYVGAGELREVPAAGGPPRLVSDQLGGMPFLAGHDPRLSPDGKWVAYLSNAADATGEGLEVEIWLQPVEQGGPARQLTHLGASINSFQWAPDSVSVVLSSSRTGRYNVYRVDISSQTTVRITNDRLYEVYPTHAGTSRLLFVRLNDAWTRHEIWSIDDTTGKRSLLAADEDFFDYQYGRTFGYPLPSPRGDRVLFRSHRSGWINYWAASLTEVGTESRALAPAEADQSEASWSPDGSRLAYIENHNGTLELKVLEVDSGRIATLDGGEDSACSLPAWSRDGSRIAYLRQTTTSPLEIWVVEVGSEVRKQLTGGDGAALDLIHPTKVAYPTFDGRQINAYLYLPPGASEVAKAPGLMWIHGGPTSQFSDTLQPWVQFFAQRGYAVLLPNIRGSSGYGKEFEDLNNRDWGHDDLKDVLAGVEYLKTLGTVDGDRVGIHGTSYGGCMSMSAIAWAPGVFRAAIPHAGYGEWEAMYVEQELRHLQLLRYEFGPYPEAADVYRRCSPYHDIAAIETPTLIVHGEGRLPRSDSSRQFAEEMRRLYKPVRYRTYGGECYYVRTAEGVERMLTDMLSFLDQHLKGDQPSTR